MSNFDNFLKKQLENPKIKAEYDALSPEFAAIQATIDERKESGLTQKELANPSVKHSGDSQ